MSAPDPASVSGPMEASILRELGISAFHRGDLELALNLMSRACGDPSAPATWHRDRAEMLDRHGHSEAAEVAARLAIRRDPDCASAWETLGTILIQRDLLEESRDCYATAVRIDPTFVHALNNLAVTLDRLGQRESAEERYRQVLHLMPESPEIQLNLAALLGELGRYKEGLAVAREVLDRHPNMMRAHSLVTDFKSTLKQRRSSPRRVERTRANRFK